MNSAPFYVGQEVVCVIGSSAGPYEIKEGQVYRVVSLFQCSCGVWQVDIGVRHDYDGSSCYCKAKFLNKVLWADAKLLAPIERTRTVYVAIAESVKEQSKELILS